MDTKTHIVSSAERAFDRHGFTATGMDRLTSAADVSSRTLYKHVGSKDALVVAVLEARCRRFFGRFEVDSVDALFAALADWTRKEGARGCLFFRAEGETGGISPEVSEAVSSYRKGLRGLIRKIVSNELGADGGGMLAEQILVLFEGATAAASYRGAKAIGAARAAAAALMGQARSRGTKEPRR